MGVEDLAGLATEASAVASNVLENGQEFLSDGFNQLQEQVSTFAGESSWFNSNFIGDIVPTDFTTLTNNFNFDSLTSNFTSTFPGLSNILPNPTSIANNLVNQVQNTAVSLATNTVKQAVASVLPPTLQPYANQAINSTVRSIGSAVSSTIPGTPGFVGPPAPSTAYARVDPTTLEGFGVPATVDPRTLEGFGIQATVDPTTLEGYGVNEVGATQTSTRGVEQPDTVPGEYTTDSKGNTYITLPDGTTALYRASETDTSADANVGYVTGQDPENGTYYVKNEKTGQIVATGLTQQQALLQAQDQTFVDAGDVPPSNAASNLIVKANAPGTVNDPSLATPPLDTAALAILASLAPGESALINGQFITAGSPAALALADAAARTTGLLRQAQNQQTARIQSNNNAATGDWRVRLQLADSSDYLYNAPDCGPLLWPLRDTNGVIFPYTPSIDTAYKANYTTYDLTHSNYRGYFYQGSYVDTINIKATFTAQDTAEANYLLAVIHFFRTVTKMFYGQDAQRGSPPPMVFLSGLGDFQFNKHPCLVSQFNYNLPADVNYIRAQSTVVNGSNQLAARTRQTTLGNPIASTVQRLASLGQKIFPGAVTAPFAPQGSLAAGNPTYVPTKMDINLSLLPVQSRSQVSQQFSVRGFANGNLLKGGFW